MAKEGVKKGPWGGTRPPQGPGYGGPAKGPGYGGRAKGTGNGHLGVAVVAEDRLSGAQPHAPDIRAAAAEKKARREAQAEKLKEELYRLATEAENEHARIAAINGFLDRVEGKPTQRTDVGTLGPDGELIDPTRLTVEDTRPAIDALIAGATKKIGVG